VVSCGTVKVLNYAATFLLTVKFCFNRIIPKINANRISTAPTPIPVPSFIPVTCDSAFASNAAHRVKADDGSFSIK
jgi:hypothetical protein